MLSAHLTKKSLKSQKMMPFCIFDAFLHKDAGRHIIKTLWHCGLQMIFLHLTHHG